VKTTQTSELLPELFHLRIVATLMMLLQLRKILLTVSAHEERLATEVDDMAQATQPAMATLF
jgi:hypothetical protein